MFPAAPFDPLSLASAPPTREVKQYSYSAGIVEAELFHPASRGQHAALVLLLGAGELPRSELAVHFAEALARLGIVALIPQSSGLAAERLTFDEVDGLRASLDLLAAQPDVDQGRVGLVGLSAAGGLCIVAAGQPELRDRVRFVNSFGSYAEARSLIADVASRSIEVDGRELAWQPDERTVRVVANALDDAGLDDAARDELLQGVSRERAGQILETLPPVVSERLARLSPSTYLDQVRAHIYLMHDVDDSFIPFTESRDLVAEAPPGVVKRYTEFSIFAHVIPDRPVPWQTFVPELWRLFWHVHAVLLELV
jgi:dienelactone hydrolase